MKSRFAGVDAISALVAAMLTLNVIAGCGKADPLPPPPKPMPDWKQVEASEPERAKEAMARLCRLLDKRFGGATPAVTLTFVGNGANDPKGAYYEVSAEDWKSLHEFLSGPDGAAYVGSAMSQSVGNYGDGYGRVARHEYTAKPGSETEIIFTSGKKVDGDSNG